jgi:hypothetical protein
MDNEKIESVDLTELKYTLIDTYTLFKNKPKTTRYRNGWNLNNGGNIHGIYATVTQYTNNDILIFYINSSCFIYILTHSDIRHKIIENKCMSFEWLSKTLLYRKDCDEHYIFNNVLPIDNNLTNIVNVNLVCTEILNQLDNLRNMKIQYIKNKFEETFKYCDYAIEECLTSKKIMTTIERMNMYNDELDNIVTTLIIEPIRKHICCISIYTIFDIQYLFIFDLHQDIMYQILYDNIFFLKN